MIAEALFQILTSHAGLAALIGDRVYPVAMPQDAELPAVTYQRVSTAREYASGGPVGSATVTVQINVWEPDPLKASEVGDQVVAAMHGAWNTTVAGVDIGAVLCVNEMDAYDQEADTAGVQFEWSVQYSE